MPTLEALRSELEAVREMTMSLPLGEDGTWDPETLADLEVLNLLLGELAGEQGSVERKLDGYLERYVAFQEAAEAKRLRAKELCQRAATIERRADWLERTLEAFLLAFPQFAGRELPGGRLDLKPAAPCVEVVDRELIPAAWRRTIPEAWEPNKKELLPALKKGEVIPGVKLGGGDLKIKIKRK